MAAGSIVIDLLMRTGSFETDANRAARASQKLANEIDKQFKAIGTAVGAAAVAGFGALTLAVRNTVTQAGELQKLSSLTGSTVEEFQRFAAASSTVGIEQEKLGDIFKDFREKVGEFVQTGGGGMKDFFEQIAPKVGVTAEAFRNLSGPKALQLYVDSLEKAGLSQEQMSFYLESMASDTTALIPLLRGGGEELGRLGDQAEKTGQILSTETVASAVELRSQMQQLEGILTGVRNTIAAAVIPTLIDFGNQLLDARDAGLSFIEALVGLGLADPSKSAREQVERLEASVASLRKEMDKPLLFQTLEAALGGEDRIEQLEKELAYWQRQAEREAVAIGPPLPPGFGNSTPTANFTPPTKPSKPTGSGAPKVSDLQRMSRAFADQAATVGMTAEQIELYRFQLAGASPSQIAFAASVQSSVSAFEAQSRALSEGRGVMEAVRTPAETYAAEIERLNGLLDRGAVSQETYSRAVFAAQDAFNDTQESVRAAREDLEKLNAMLDATPTARLEATRADMLLLRDAFVSGRIDAEKFVEAAQTRLGTLPDTIGQATDAMSAFADQAARNMQGAFADFLFDPFQDGVDGMLKSFGVTLQRMIAEAVAADLFNRIGAFGKSNSGAGGVLGAVGSIASFFGGAREHGGPVSAGKTYLVGERGPELFRPGTAGSIVPNEALGRMARSGGDTTINVVVQGGSAPDVRRAAGQGAREALSAFSGAQRYA